MLGRFLTISLIALTFGACASTPDPAKVCTAEWIEPRAERAIERIEKRSSKALNAFEDVGKDWLNGGSPGPMQLFRLSNAMEKLEKELRDGQGIRDLRLLASTCDDPDLIRTRLTEFLDRQSFPKSVTDFLDRMGLLDRLITMAEGEDSPDGQS